MIRRTSAAPADFTQNLQGGAIVLLREVTHRINNEFASLIGLMQRGARELTDAKAKAVVDSMIECLYSHAEVHQALAMPESDELIDAAGYLGFLCKAISDSKLAPRGITLTLIAGPQYVASAQCWLLGMIVSELVTNSARHAFAEGGGVIRVDLIGRGDRVQCRVCDNGIRSAGFHPSPRRSGLKIVEALAAAMGGTFDQHLTARGARTIIGFPAVANCQSTSSTDCLNLAKAEFERCPANISGAAR